jgi:transcriptional regulator with XRE-family HTH domain
MPGPKDIDGSASLPTFYGKELRWKREQAGLTQQKLVDGSFYGASHLSEIERGERRMPLDLARHVDQVLCTDGFFARRCADVRKARRSGHADYFEKVLEAEKRAEHRGVVSHADSGAVADRVVCEGGGRGDPSTGAARGGRH